MAICYPNFENATIRSSQLQNIMISLRLSVENSWLWDLFHYNKTVPIFNQIASFLRTNIVE